MPARVYVIFTQPCCESVSVVWVARSHIVVCLLWFLLLMVYVRIFNTINVYFVLSALCGPTPVHPSDNGGKQRSHGQSDGEVVIVHVCQRVASRLRQFGV